MNINKISNSSFKGLIKLQAPINIYTKEGEEIVTKNELQEFRKNNRFSKLLGGSYTDEHQGEPVELIVNTHPAATYPLAGYFEIDTDRITEITPREIKLKSRDGKYAASVLYNGNSSQKSQWAIAAYNTAAQNNISVSIDA